MKRGINVYCVVCKRSKAPRGRSLPHQVYDSYCNRDNCIGYDHDPFPGDLFPGETEEDFGYPVSRNATEEVISQ